MPSMQTHSRAIPAGSKLVKDSDRRKLPIPVMLLLLSLVFPFLVQIGPLLLSVNRVVLLVMVVPCLFMWLSGRAGPIRTADIALLLMCLWITLGYLVIHGPGVAIEAGGMRFIETLGAFLVARCFIRDAEDFRAMVVLLFTIIVAMLPFAIYEALTGHNILLDVANAIWYSGADAIKKPRWGFDRVAGVFAHPILFGVFCSGAISLVYYVLGYGVSTFKRLLKTGLVTFTALFSLSSGPLTAILAQVLLIGWDRALARIKARWTILTGGVLSLIVALEIAANRSTPELFIYYFAFNRHTASNRLRIWDYGTQSVAEHPLFGVGNDEWERAWWMSSSMDMFWLVPAVRSGLPAALLLQVAFFSLFLAITFKKGLDERTTSYRTGYLICLVGFYIAGWTVNYWKIIYVLFMFLLGSGAWILDTGGGKVPASRKQERVPGGTRTRVSGKHATSRKPVSRHNTPALERRPKA